MIREKTDIRIDPETLERARQLAESEGLKVADILRRWIRKGRAVEVAEEAKER